jgi:hypothetical protein
MRALSDHPDSFLRGPGPVVGTVGLVCAVQKPGTGSNCHSRFRTEQKSPSRTVDHGPKARLSFWVRPGWNYSYPYSAQVGLKVKLRPRQVPSFTTYSRQIDVSGSEQALTMYHGHGPGIFLFFGG